MPLEKHEIVIEANRLKFSATSSKPAGKLQAPHSRLIILLHGFPDNRSTWDAIWEPLVQAEPQGLCIAPNLRGYEPQTACLKDTPYTVSDAAGDVISIVEKYARSSTPVYIVGHDWGAIITYQIATLRPDLAVACVCLAIPYLAHFGLGTVLSRHPMQLWYSSYMLTMRFPWLYRWRFSTKDYLRGLWQYWSPGWRYTQSHLSSVYETLQAPGVLDSATAYYRCLRKSRISWSVDFSRVKLLMVGGSTDQCMMSSIMEDDRAWLSGTRAEIKILDGLGHFMHCEDPERLAKVITDFI